MNIQRTLCDLPEVAALSRHDLDQKNSFQNIPLNVLCISNTCSIHIKAQKDKKKVMLQTKNQLKTQNLLENECF